MKTFNRYRPIKRNNHYLVRCDFNNKAFYEFSTMKMDRRMAQEMSRHCNVALTWGMPELIETLKLARERLISIDNGECFDAVVAIEKSIKELEDRIK